MKLATLIAAIRDAFPKSDGLHATLKLKGEYYPIHEIKKSFDGYYYIATYYEDCGSFHPQTWNEVIQALESLALDEVFEGISEDIVIRHNDGPFASNLRTFRIEKVSRKQDTLLLEGRYYEPGDALLLEFEYEYHPSSFIVSGIVDRIENVFSNDEVLYLANAYVSDGDGFLALDKKEPFYEEEIGFYHHELVNAAQKHFSKEEWEKLQDGISQFLILKEHLPFVKEAALKDIVASLNERVTFSCENKQQ